MTPEFVKSNHDKGSHPVYKRVPTLMEALLIDCPIIEGFVIGGSYKQDLGHANY